MLRQGNSLLQYLFSPNEVYCFYLRIRAGEEIAAALSKYAHAVIFVVKTNDPRLKDGKYKETLQKIREHFREDGNNNIYQNSSFLS